MNVRFDHHAANVQSAFVNRGGYANLARTRSSSFPFSAPPPARRRETTETALVTCSFRAHVCRNAAELRVLRRERFFFASKLQIIDDTDDRVRSSSSYESLGTHMYQQEKKIRLERESCAWRDIFYKRYFGSKCELNQNYAWIKMLGCISFLINIFWSQRINFMRGFYNIFPFNLPSVLSARCVRASSLYFPDELTR